MSLILLLQTWAEPIYIFGKIGDYFRTDRADIQESGFVIFKYTFAILFFCFMVFNTSVLADRLPQEIPENQIFSIDTLVDGTGAFVDESRMQWTLDSQDLARTRRVSNAAPGGGVMPAFGIMLLSPAPSLHFL